MQRAQAILCLSQALWASVIALPALRPNSDHTLNHEIIKSAALRSGEWIVGFQGHWRGTGRTILDGQYIDNAYVVRNQNYVRLPHWFGRLGNNLHQLFHAIVYAESQHITSVYIPPTWGPTSDLFDLPDKLELDAGTKLSSGADCSFNKINMWSYELCVLGYAKQDFRRALLTYVKPHLKQKVSEVCESKEQANHDLVIHLRGGDLADSGHPQSRMPPCAFYRYLIETHRFSGVRLVTEDGEDDRFCRKYLLNAFNGSKVRVEETNHSLVDDACTLMTSQYVAAGLSTFPESLTMMNDRFKRLYVPALKYNGNKQDITYGGSTDLAGTLQCGVDFHTCAKGFIEYELYAIPGMRKLRTGQAKVKYMLQKKIRFSRQNICGHCVV